eukprot:861999-Ditylum_brightwellii.AAC.1
MVLDLVYTCSVSEEPLCICINARLDDTGINGVFNVFGGRSGYTMEEALRGFFFVCSYLIGNVSLDAVEGDRLSVNISTGIDTVNISKGSSTGKGTGINFGKLLVGVPDLLRLSVNMGRHQI